MVQSTELSLGLRLKQAREQRGWTIEQVAAQLKLLPRIIESLETDNYSTLPEAIFIKGYVRLYANLLALPSQELCDYFDTHYAIAERELSASKFQSYALEASPVHHHSVSHHNYHGVKAKSLWPWLKYVWLMLLLVVIGLGVWQSMHTRQQTASESEANLNPPLSNKSISLPNVTSTRSAIDILQFHFSAQTKVVIRDASGNELANTTKQTGETLSVQGESPFAIELNPASAVEFRFNNQLIDLKPYTVNGVVNFRLSR